ncbi:Protein MAIN-LIKE 1 [Glycine soja]
MVKTRGLGHALGRVVARGLGRGEGDDSNGVPQQRRQTASARRRRVPIIVDDVVPAVPTDSPVLGMSPETNAQDIGAQDAADEPEGFPGGPRDPSVLTEYADHVAASVWSEQERPELKLSSHGRKVHNLGRPVLAIEDMVVGTGLSPLIACSIDTGNRGLISSFVERWHRETSSFHLPVVEVSIMLDDVALRTDEAVVLLVELLMRWPWSRQANVVDHMYACSSCETYTSANVRCSTRQLPLVLIFYIFWVALFLLIRVQPMFMSHTYRPCVTSLLLGDMHGELLASPICTINLMMPVSAPANSLLVTSPCYSAGYRSTFRQLRSAMLIRTTTRYHDVRVDCEEGIYNDVQAAPGSSENPRCLLDVTCEAPTCAGLSSDFVLLGTNPLGACCCQIQTEEGYAPVRLRPVHSCTPCPFMGDTWTHYSDHLAIAGDLCVVPGQCAPNYIDWFFVISHPFMTAPQMNPPRDAYATQPSHIPHEATPASTHVDLDADEPRHAVEACHAIVDALEQHLNAPSTSTHEEVIQKCLRIARGVTEDRNVYVRSQRRDGWSNIIDALHTNVISSLIRQFTKVKCECYLELYYAHIYAITQKIIKTAKRFCYPPGLYLVYSL